MRTSAENTGLHAFEHGIIDLNWRKALLRKALRRPRELSMPASEEEFDPSCFFTGRWRFFAAQQSLV